MENDRIKNYLDQILSRQGGSQKNELFPLIDRWRKILNSIPSLVKRSPWRHCRIGDLKNGVVTVETDHPAWMQILLWEEEKLLLAIKTHVPELSVVAIRFRTNKSGEAFVAADFEIPTAEKQDLSPEEERAKQEMIRKLEEMIRKTPQ
ncbi:MAG: DUF721 domain-containing protein [Spirochaetales bacterium]|nr:DUF721 domain-containing protein [Spirochaetales bacterium]